jgi:hypothetical protein
VAGHPHPQPPRTRGPPAPREPPAGLLRPLAPREPPAGPPTALLPPSAADPRHSKPQERPPIGVRRPKCLVNKNNDKIYQMKQ